MPKTETKNQGCFPLTKVATLKFDNGYFGDYIVICLIYVSGINLVFHFIFLISVKRYIQLYFYAYVIQYLNCIDLAFMFEFHNVLLPQLRHLKIKSGLGSSDVPCRQLLSMTNKLYYIIAAASCQFDITSSCLNYAHHTIMHL